MELHIYGHGIELDESVKDYTRSKIDRLERAFNGVMHAQVKYSAEQASYSAELVLSVPAGRKLTASAEGPDCLAAFDLALDKAERQLRKHKERLRERRRRGDRRSQQG